MTVTASSTSNVKHEVLSRSGRVPAASQSKTNGGTATKATSLATKKPQLKQATSTLVTTVRTSLKRGNASSPAVKQGDNKEDKADHGDKSSGGKSSATFCMSKLADLSSSSVVEGNVVRSDQITVLSSVDVVQGSLLPVDTSDSLHDDCVVSESDQLSHSNSESLPCEMLRSSIGLCEHVSQSTDLIVPINCADSDGSDLEETSICDISLNSCRSDCSTSLFHSACSSVIGSITDMKPPSLNGLLENDNLGIWSGSNSVSMESLQSSAGYCTPGEDGNLCENADCTISNTDDTRYV